MSYTYKPFKYFLITLLGTWIPLFLAAYFGSSQKGVKSNHELFFLIFAIFVPSVTALSMIYGSKNKQLINDFWKRLCPYLIKTKYLLVIVALMPAVLFVATAISLVFGQPIEQFTISDEFNVMKGWNLLSALVSFSIVPVLEELGWRGYGVDSLRAYFNLFVTSLLFACFWGLWHLPLFFLNGFYHHDLWNLGIIYVINYFVCLFPLVIMMNWFYYKNCRNITTSILFHSMINVGAVLFNTEQFTKCIITVLLYIISTVIIQKNKKFFFSKNINDSLDCSFIAKYQDN